MSHRGNTRSPSLEKRAARYVNGDKNRIGRAMRRLIVTAYALYALGLGLTLLGCVLAVINPFIVLTIISVGQYAVVAMCLTMLGAACYAGMNIWRHGTGLNRFSLVAAPLFAVAVVWQNKQLVLDSTDALGRALYSADGLYFPEGSLFVALVLTFVVQAMMWAALFAVVVGAMHGLGINMQRLNQPPHKLTDAKTGPGQAAFYHFAAGYGFTFLAVAAWFPFFTTLI